MVYITGDTHRDARLPDIAEFCFEYETTEDDVIVILGDVGINFYGEQDDRYWKEELCGVPVTLLCIHGNHEDRPENITTYEEADWKGGTVYCEPEFPNLLFAKDGEIYELEGYRCLAIGGAYSVDGSGWPDEQPSEETKEYVERQIESAEYRIDVVFSHTCPYKHIPEDAFLPGVNESTVDRSTEYWLDTIENRLNNPTWYCGHFHIDRFEANLRFVYREFLELEDY